MMSYGSACFGSSSSSVKLLLFIVPLILLSTVVVFPGLISSNWNILSNNKLPSSGFSVNSSLKENERILDLSSRVVVDLHNMEEAVKDESLNNRSSSPLAIEAIAIHQENLTKLESSNESTSGPIAAPVAAPVMTASHAHSMKTKASMYRGNTKLQKIEAGLERARAVIREAKSGNQTEDPDFIPIGPMYWNARAFHRSYLEMQRQFKVYVYEEGEPPLFHDGPCKSIYSIEGNFIHAIEMADHFRTRDPEKAHMYFLPFSVAKLVQFVYPRESRNFSPIRRTVIDYLNIISGKYPFWNRSLGADHFMLACHDWGPETSFSIPNLFQHSVRALCNANTSEGFKAAKDVSIPEINLQTGTIDGFLGGPSPSQRPILAFFAGGLHGPIRPVLLKHWEKKDEDIKVQRYLPRGVSYYEMMRKSKYCICPSGYEVASPRIVEAIYTGCVPVLISENYVPPFSDVLNWKSFSVEVSVRDTPNLKKILMSISPRQYIRMHRRVLQVRRHFEVHSPPKRFDVFHMILHSIWLRRLNVRLRDDL